MKEDKPIRLNESIEEDIKVEDTVDDTETIDEVVNDNVEDTEIIDEVVNDTVEDTVVEDNENSDEVSGEDIDTSNDDEEVDEQEKMLEERRRQKREKSLKKRSRKMAKKHLFSKALFKENFKSHLKSLLIVSIGNALIMAIIIGILSGLHINSTSTALKDLFGNADTESTVKEGAISFYSAFEGCSVSFDTIKDGKKTINKTLEKVLELPNDKTTLTKIDALKLLYNGKYALTTGTDKEKHLASKEYALQEAKKTFTSQMPEVEQDAIIMGLDAFLDEYFSDNGATTKDLVNRVIDKHLASIITKLLELDTHDEETINLLIKSLVADYNNSKNNKKEVLEEYTLSFFRFAVKGEERVFADELSLKLLEAFRSNKNKYMTDNSVENNILKEEITKECLRTIDNIAYIKYLPDFVVDYYTSNFGYPITYVKTGEYNENGTEKLKMMEVKVYNPDVYIKKEAKMGTVSSLVEKLHKEVITGVAYTKEEIDEAKVKAKEDIAKINVILDEYFNDYIKNYDNYHVNGKVDEDILLRKAVVLVKMVAEKQLIDDFNKNNKIQISSIDEITVNNYSMDGKELMQYVDNYAASGITSYKTYRADSLMNGYNKSEAQMIAVSKGSLGVINQLPSSIQDSLEEMGDMNTYGIIVGVIAFGIAVLLIPMVYTVLTANSLVSEKIETGSLAFTMSTPISRGSFIFTSGLYLIFSEVFMAVVLTLVSILAQILGGYFGSGDLLSALPIKDIALYGLGNFMVSLAISGICFMSSCFFNKTNNNIGVSGGISIFFFICAILGLFATKAIPGTIRITSMNIFNYLTIFSLFDSLAVMDGSLMIYSVKLLVLLGITVVTYIIGSIKFTKKDLPL